MDEHITDMSQLDELIDSYTNELMLQDVDCVDFDQVYAVGVSEHSLKFYFHARLPVYVRRRMEGEDC